MSADAPRRAGRGEEHDDIAAELDVGLQRGALRGRQRGWAGSKASGVKALGPIGKRG